MPDTDFYGRIHPYIRWPDPTDCWEMEDPPLLQTMLFNFYIVPVICKPSGPVLRKKRRCRSPMNWGTAVTWSRRGWRAMSGGTGETHQSLPALGMVPAGLEEIKCVESSERRGAMLGECSQQLWPWRTAPGSAPVPGDCRSRLANRTAPAEINSHCFGFCH